MADTSVPKDRLFEIGRELVALAKQPQSLTVKHRKGMSSALVPAVHGAAMHCVDLGDAALDVYESGREIASVPLMRACYESGLTAAWLVQNPEAVRGFVNEEARQRRNLSRGMSQSTTDIFRDGSTRIAHANDALIQSAADDQARHMERLCKSLNGGHDAYLYYRFMSSSAHVSAHVVDHYIHEVDDSPAGVTLNVDAAPIGHDGWLHLTVASMIWGLRAIDHLDQSHRMRSELRSHARELSIVDKVTMTPKALASAWAAEQARRRAEWKGPRDRRPRGE